MNTTLKIAAASLVITTVAQSADNIVKKHDSQINSLDQSIFLDENLNPRLGFDVQKIIEQSAKEYEENEKKREIEELESAKKISLTKMEKKDLQKINEQIELDEINEMLEVYHLNEFIEKQDNKKQKDEQQQIESDYQIALNFLDQSCIMALNLQFESFDQNDLQNSTIFNNDNLTNSVVHTNKDILKLNEINHMEKSINIETIYQDAANFLYSLRNEIEKKHEYSIYLETLKDLKDVEELLNLSKEQLEDLPKKIEELKGVRLLLNETKIPYKDILIHNGLLNDNQKYIIDDEITKTKFKNNKVDIVDSNFISGIIIEYNDKFNSLPIEIQFITQRLNSLQIIKNSAEFKSAAEGIDKEYETINKVKALSEKFKINEKKAQDILNELGL